jgi:lipopolysaccharide export system permease protein
MKRLQAYVLAEFAAPFVLSVSVFTFVMLLDKLLDLLDMIVTKGVPIDVVLEVFLLLLPSMIAVVVPMGVLAGVLMAFGRMAGDLEITAMKASGVGVLTVMAPMLVLAAAMGGILAVFSDRVLPDANHLARNLLLDISTMRPSARIVPGMFVTEIEGFTIYAGAKDDITGTLEGVYIEQRIPEGPTRTITAAEGSIEPISANRIGLVLSDGEIHEAARDGTYRLMSFTTYEVQLQSSEEVVRRERETRGDREMSADMMRAVIDSLSLRRTVLADSLRDVARAAITGVASAGMPFPGADSCTDPRARYNLSRNEINRTAADLRIMWDISAAAGRTIDKLEVEISKKHSIPFACVVFVLLGVPLALSVRQGGAGVSLGVSLLFILVYYLFLLGGEQLGDRGLIPGWLAMWSPNILLGALGVYLTARSIQEGTPVPLPDLRRLRERLAAGRRGR